MEGEERKEGGGGGRDAWTENGLERERVDASNIALYRF